MLSGFTNLWTAEGNYCFELEFFATSLYADFGCLF